MNPWEKYPEVWPTESKFWSYVRGGLRGGLWNKSPIKLEMIKQSRERIPGKKEGTTRWGGKCNKCKELFPQSQLQVDHLEGNISLKSWEDIAKFVQHLLAPTGLQLLCKKCHKTKSHSEKTGLSFEEALIEKHTIEICKQPKEQVLDFLREKGYNVSVLKNAKQRREAVKDVLSNE